MVEQDTFCGVDLLEDNDSLDAAVPISLNTDYILNLVGDRFDAVSVQLDENVSYQVNNSDAASFSWVYTVFNDRGERVIDQPVNDSASVYTATESGKRIFVFWSRDLGAIDPDTTISIRTQ